MGNRLWLSVCLTLHLVFFAASGWGQDSTYLDLLISEARNKELAQQLEWLNLVHYKRNTITSGFTSLADGQVFFNAIDGKTNPSAELEATLAAFFSNRPLGGDPRHPQCRFMARYHWLKGQLKFDLQRLPEWPCERFETWYRAIDPSQLTLVFPAAYLNNPSSMFGHTLLRFDRPGQDERTRLISYAINYAAQTTETNGVIFAIKGLTGGYPGQFSIMPYYQKVKEYSDLENRDIWEYQLNFTPEETRRLLEHVWELGPVHFQYYFFDENCSYMLLALMEVARPGLGLTDQFSTHAIPSDTVRVVLEEKDLLKKAVFRPANRTRIGHRLSYLDEHDQQLAYELAQGVVTVDDPAIQPFGGRAGAQILELAHAYLQYQLNTGERTRDEVAGRSLQLLKARSRLKGESEAVPPLEPPAERPDEGHGSARLALGAGQFDGESFLELKIRPAYHDLLDPDGGYTPGAQIDFLDTSVRYDWEDEEVELQSLSLIDIFSLSPRSRFFRPLSWKVNVGLERLPIEDQDPELVFTVNVGAGLAYSIKQDLLFFGMIEGTLAADNGIENDHALGAGPGVGLLWKVNSRNRFWFSSRLQRFSENLDLTYVEHRLAHNFQLADDASLRLTLEQSGDKADTKTDFTLGILLYF